MCESRQRDGAITPSSDVRKIDSVTCLGQLFFTWITPLINYGRTHSIKLSDFYNLGDQFKCNNVVDNFQSVWDAEVRVKGKETSLASVLFKLYRREMFVVELMLTLACVCSLVGPAYFIRQLILYSGAQETNLSKGLPLALGLFLNEMLRSVAVNRYWYLASRVALKVRATVFGKYVLVLYICCQREWCASRA
jgi:hypothetical protein